MAGGDIVGDGLRGPRRHFHRDVVCAFGAFGNMLHRPIAWLAVGGAAIFTGIRSRMEFRAFAGSPARPACRSGYSADNSLFEMLCWMSVGIFPIIRGIDESTTFDVQGSLFESLWIDRSRSV
jgi:hypothetical protein